MPPSRRTTSPLSARRPGEERASAGGCLHQASACWGGRGTSPRQVVGSAATWAGSLGLEADAAVEAHDLTVERPPTWRGTSLRRRVPPASIGILGRARNELAPS